MRKGQQECTWTEATLWEGIEGGGFGKPGRDTSEKKRINLDLGPLSSRTMKN